MVISQIGSQDKSWKHERQKACAASFSNPQNGQDFLAAPVLAEATST